MILQVAALRHEAEGVIPLSEWQPGTHADLWLLSPDRAAQYSLCGNPVDKTCWTLAVHNEPEGQGISRYVSVYREPPMPTKV